MNSKSINKIVPISPYIIVFKITLPYRSDIYGQLTSAKKKCPKLVFRYLVVQSFSPQFIWTYIKTQVDVKHFEVLQPFEVSIFLEKKFLYSI